MSEYQYYEFAAFDRPLTERQMTELRALSTRARITPTSFVNEYNWGDFKGDPHVLMERYFDAFLYLANWGTHRFMLRVPRAALDGKTAALYAAGDRSAARGKGEHVVLAWLSEDEEGDWDDEAEPHLSTLVGVRDEILRGDKRALYLGWLLAAQRGDLGDEVREPPVPANLNRLSASLRAFADFLRIDPALIEVAAGGSARIDEESSERAASVWIRALSEARRIALLERVARGDGATVQAEIRRSITETQRKARSDGNAAGRTVGGLLEAARAHAEVMARREEERAARERARRQKKEAEERAKYLDALAKRESAVWQQVAAHLATSRFTDHDAAVRLLKDLRDLAARRRQAGVFAQRIADMRERNAKRPGLMKRLDQAGLGSAIATGAEAGPLWAATRQGSRGASPTKGRR